MRVKNQLLYYSTALLFQAFIDVRDIYNFIFMPLLMYMYFSTPSSLPFQLEHTHYRPKWIERVIRRVEHYKNSEHHSLLENATTRLD